MEGGLSLPGEITWAREGLCQEILAGQHGPQRSPWSGETARCNNVFLAYVRMVYDRSNTVHLVLPFSIQPGRVVTLVEAQEVSNHTRISVVGNSRKFIVATSWLHYIMSRGLDNVKSNYCVCG